jgi:rubrerythrin
MMGGMTATHLPTNLSASERLLYEHLQQHIQTESGMEDLYDTLAACGHPYITFLADLIAQDEARHHRIFQDWMDSLKAMSELDQGKEPIPLVDRAPVHPETIALVDRLLEFEKDDLAAVKKLRKEVADVGEFGVWQALLETLVADTQKHIGILKFIKKQLRASR